MELLSYISLVHRTRREKKRYYHTGKSFACVFIDLSDMKHYSGLPRDLSDFSGMHEHV